MFVKGVPSSCQCNYSHTVKMRYQNEIEEILRISEEFGSKIKNKYIVLQAIYREQNWKNNDLASLGQKLASMSTLFKLRNEIARFIQDLERKNKNLDSKFSKGTVSEHSSWVEVQKAILPYVEESITLLDIVSHKLRQLKDEVESILMTSGHYDPADLSPYLKKDNQDQLIMLKIILKLLHPNGRSHCSDSKVIETEAPRNDMITVDLKTQDTQLNSKQNPMPKKTMTPKYKFKRIKKGGKVQKNQSPGVHKMKFKPSHRNERIYWSKQLCYVNNVSHDSNSFTLHKLCHMATSNINGLHAVTHPQNMWLLTRPRVKIK